MGGVGITDWVYLGVKARQRQVEVLLDADVLRPVNHRIDELLACRDRRDHWRRLLQVPTQCHLPPDLVRPASRGLHSTALPVSMKIYRCEDA